MQSIFHLIKNMYNDKNIFLEFFITNLFNTLLGRNGLYKQTTMKHVTYLMRSFLAAIAALYVTMSVGRSVRPSVRPSDSNEFQN